MDINVGMTYWTGSRRCPRANFGISNADTLGCAAAYSTV